MNWRDHAACRDENPELFFPVGTFGPALRQADEAKAVCAHCPVITACRSWAVATLPHGIAGGLTEDERHVLRTAQQQAAA